MRSLLIAAGIVLLLLFLLTAVPIVTGGKGLVFGIGAGHSGNSGRVMVIALETCAACLVLAALLFASGRLFPRKYYPLLRWRELFLTGSAIALIVAAGAIIWRQLAYGIA